MNVLLKVLYRCYRLGAALWWWLRRRFRPLGFGLIAGLFATGGIGLDTTQGVAHVAFGVIFALLTVAVLGGARFRGRFSVERRLPRFATVGQPLRYTIRVGNKDARLQRGLVVFETTTDSRMSYEEFVSQLRAESARSRSFRLGQPYRKPPRASARIAPAELPPLPAGGEGEAVIEFTPQRRGVMRFYGVRIGCPDPLGIFIGAIRVAVPGRVLILPRRYPVPALALPGASHYQQGGVALASSVGESEEFVALREYRPGDAPKRIHWPSWARVGVPVVREYQDEYFVRHALILDTFTDAPDSELFEDAVSVAASFAYAIQAQEALLDLMFVGPEAFCFTAGRGLAHTEQMLEILAAVQPCRDRSFEALEQLVTDHVSAVSGCVVVLLRWDEARSALIRKLEALRLPVLVTLVVEIGETAAAEAGIGADRPLCLRIVESGRVGEGLSRL